MGCFQSSQQDNSMPEPARTVAAEESRPPAAAQHSEECLLFSILPPELRLYIYETAFPSLEESMTTTPDLAANPRLKEPALLQTSKTIRHEAMETYCRHLWTSREALVRAVRLKYEEIYNPANPQLDLHNFTQLVHREYVPLLGTFRDAEIALMAKRDQIEKQGYPAGEWFDRWYKGRHESLEGVSKILTDSTVEKYRTAQSPS